MNSSLPNYAFKYVAQFRLVFGCEFLNFIFFYPDHDDSSARDRLVFLNREFGAPSVNHDATEFYIAPQPKYGCRQIVGCKGNEQDYER